jgi:SAM-dependent methyltransferase
MSNTARVEFNGRAGTSARPERCPVCDGPYMAHCRKVKDVDLFVCLECLSFCSPFAEPIPPGNSTKWHTSVAERNIGWARELFKMLNPSYVLEIGTGIGTVLRAAKEAGGDGVGFDLNKAAIAHGRDVFGLDLRAELWSRATLLKRAPSCILCIMVLEHIHQPRELLMELVKAGADHKCPVFISVPWFNKRWWPHLLTEPAEAEEHPFRQPSVHVTHFSNAGFEMACRSFGATSIQPLIAGGWSGFVVSPP